MRRFERLLAGLDKAELALIAGELLARVELAEAAEKNYAEALAEEKGAGNAARRFTYPDSPASEMGERADVVIGPYEKVLGEEYVYDTHEKRLGMEWGVSREGEADDFAARRAETENPGADIRTQAKRLSDFLRRDSHRYDSGFTRY